MTSPVKWFAFHSWSRRKAYSTYLYLAHIQRWKLRSPCKGRSCRGPSPRAACRRPTILAASQLAARLLVLLAGMLPVPAESPGQWWASTGYRQAAGQQARIHGGKTGAGLLTATAI